MKKALWIEVLGDSPPLGSQDALEGCKDFLQRYGFNAVYLQVYRAGEAWFPTDHLLQSRYTKKSPDLVADMVQWGRQQGIEVHLWCNIFHLAENLAAATFFKEKFGDEVFLVNNYLQGPPFDTGSEKLHMDAPGYWLDPSHTALRAFYGDVTQSLCELYPSASGLHLDYFRYPYYLPIRPSSAVACGADFGYGKKSLEQFSKDAGSTNSFVDTEGKLLPANYDISLVWDSWRRARLDAYLETFRAILPTDMKLSVASVAWPERAYMSAFQNWPAWLQQGKVDTVLTMSYTADHEMFEQLLRQSMAFQTEHSRVLPGIGAYIFTNEESFQHQCKIICDFEEIDGYCLFSYRNLSSRSWDLATI